MRNLDDLQEPMTSLNPVFRIGEQIAEVVRLHQGLTAGMPLPAVSRCSEGRYSCARKEGEGLSSPAERRMRQRVMIAIALACRPRLMLAMSRRPPSM